VNSGNLVERGVQTNELNVSGYFTGRRTDGDFLDSAQQQQDMPASIWRNLLSGAWRGFTGVSQISRTKKYSDVLGYPALGRISRRVARRAGGGSRDGRRPVLLERRKGQRDGASPALQSAQSHRVTAVDYRYREFDRISMASRRCALSNALSPSACRFTKS
jgi:hypothetical protein